MQRANKTNQGANIGHHAVMPYNCTADASKGKSKPRRSSINALTFYGLEDEEDRFAYLDYDQERLDIEALRRLPKHQRAIPMDMTRYL